METVCTGNQPVLPQGIGGDGKVISCLSGGEKMAWGLARGSRARLPVGSPAWHRQGDMGLPRTSTPGEPGGGEAHQETATCPPNPA